MSCVACNHLLTVTDVETVVESDGVTYRWRGPLTDAEMVELVHAHGGNPSLGWWDRIRPHSLGWVTARTGDGVLVGFANVASDGGDHAFLIDPKTHGSYQRQGIGTRAVLFAAQHAKAAGCDWLHVDFEDGLEPFYVDACGFRPTPAGLLHLRSFGD
jgi:GNAT superfamily N-acetyltransferase